MYEDLHLDKIYGVEEAVEFESLYYYIFSLCKRHMRIMSSMCALILLPFMYPDLGMSDDCMSLTYRETSAAVKHKKGDSTFKIFDELEHLPMTTVTHPIPHSKISREISK